MCVLHLWLRNYSLLVSAKTDNFIWMYDHLVISNIGDQFFSSSERRQRIWLFLFVCFVCLFILFSCSLWRKTTLCYLDHNVLVFLYQFLNCGWNYRIGVLSNLYVYMSVIWKGFTSLCECIMLFYLWRVLINWIMNSLKLKEHCSDQFSQGINKAKT